MLSGAYIFCDSGDGCLRSGRACASHGIHYLDLAGEPHFIKTTIQKSVKRSHFPIPRTHSQKTDTIIWHTETTRS